MERWCLRTTIPVRVSFVPSESADVTRTFMYISTGLNSNGRGDSKGVCVPMFIPFASVCAIAVWVDVLPRRELGTSNEVAVEATLLHAGASYYGTLWAGLSGGAEFSVSVTTNHFVVWPQNLRI